MSQEDISEEFNASGCLQYIKDLDTKVWRVEQFNRSRAQAYRCQKNENVADAVPESPYEEMMVRFQIRQLQRSASGMTGASEGRRGSAASSQGLDAEGTSRVSTTSIFGETSVNKSIDPDDQSNSMDGETARMSASQRPISISPHGNSHSDHHVKRLRPADTPFEHCYASLRRLISKIATPISPFSGFSQARYVGILLVGATYAVLFPLGFAFPNEQQFDYVDLSVGAVLVLDLLITLHTSYVADDGSLITSHLHIFCHYLKSRFVLDALFAAPLIAHVNGTKSGPWMHFVLSIVSMERLGHISRLVRMIWLMRINQTGSGNNFWAWLLYSRYSHLLRIAGNVAMLVAIAHYIACVWAVLLNAEGDDEEADFQSWHDQYSFSFYSALLLLQGEGVSTDTAGQNLFASVSVLIGSIVLAIVFGHVAVLVSNFNASSTNYQRKMEGVIAMTAKLQLPPSLRERIHEYYEHLWHEYECLDGDVVQFSKELSHTLGLEVVLFKYMELVMHVPFWKDCTPDFQKQLMLRLDVRVYLPNDFIMREGEVDDEFYMINRGYCELRRQLHKFERVSSTSIGNRNSGHTAQSMMTSRSNGGMTSRRRHSSLHAANLNDGARQSAYELDPAQARHYSNTGRRHTRLYEVLLTRGQAFGDLALLMNYPRAANVRAITHVEMCILSRENFQAVITRCPGDRYRVIVDMLTSYMQSCEASQSQCPLLELVRKVYSAEAITNACSKAEIAPPFIPPMLAARQAAERIYTAINVELRDATLKFGVSADIREQLTALRERRKQETKLKSRVHNETSDDNEIASDVARAQVTRIEPGGQTCECCWHRQNTHSRNSFSPLMVRLQQAEEREVVILRALQDLQADVKLLRAKKDAINRSIAISRDLPTR